MHSSHRDQRHMGVQLVKKELKATAKWVKCLQVARKLSQKAPYYWAVVKVFPVIRKYFRMKVKQAQGKQLDKEGCQRWP